MIHPSPVTLNLQQLAPQEEGARQAAPRGAEAKAAALPRLRALRGSWPPAAAAVAVAASAGPASRGPPNWQRERATQTMATAAATRTRPSADSAKAAPGPLPCSEAMAQYKIPRSGSASAMI